MARRKNKRKEDVVVVVANDASTPSASTSATTTAASSSNSLEEPAAATTTPAKMIAATRSSSRSRKLTPKASAEKTVRSVSRGRRAAAAALVVVANGGSDDAASNNHEGTTAAAVTTAKRRGRSVVSKSTNAKSTPVNKNNRRRARSTGGNAAEDDHAMPRTGGKLRIHIRMEKKSPGTEDGRASPKRQQQQERRGRRQSKPTTDVIDEQLEEAKVEIAQPKRGRGRGRSTTPKRSKSAPPPPAAMKVETASRRIKSKGRAKSVVTARGVGNNVGEVKVAVKIGGKVRAQKIMAAVSSQSVNANRNEVGEVEQRKEVTVAVKIGGKVRAKRVVAALNGLKPVAATSVKKIRLKVTPKKNQGGEMIVSQPEEVQVAVKIDGKVCAKRVIAHLAPTAKKTTTATAATKRIRLKVSAKVNNATESSGEEEEVKKPPAKRIKLSVKKKKEEAVVKPVAKRIKLSIKKKAPVDEQINNGEESEDEILTAAKASLEAGYAIRINNSSTINNGKKKKASDMCIYPGCPRYRRARCGGYCFTHVKTCGTVAPPTTSPSMKKGGRLLPPTTHLVPSQEKDKKLCKFPGCERYKRSSSGGYCLTHVKNGGEYAGGAEEEDVEIVETVREVNVLVNLDGERMGATCLAEMKEVKTVPKKKKARVDEQTRQRQEETQETNDATETGENAKDSAAGDDTAGALSAADNASPAATAGATNGGKFCKFDGCTRWKQSKCGGYCLTHAEHGKQNDATLPPAEIKGPTNSQRCKFEGCEKYKQTDCNGFCLTHLEVGQSMRNGDMLALGMANSDGNTVLIKVRVRNNAKMKQSYVIGQLDVPIYKEIVDKRPVAPPPVLVEKKKKQPKPKEANGGAKKSKKKNNPPAFVPTLPPFDMPGIDFGGMPDFGGGIDFGGMPDFSSNNPFALNGASQMNYNTSTFGGGFSMQGVSQTTFNGSSFGATGNLSAFPMFTGTGLNAEANLPSMSMQDASFPVNNNGIAGGTGLPMTDSVVNAIKLPASNDIQQKSAITFTKGMTDGTTDMETDKDGSELGKKPSSKRVKRTIDHFNLPEGIILANKPSKNTKGTPLCLVIGCPKQYQTGCEGCCRSHFSKLSVEVECGEDNESEEDEKPARPAPKLRSIDRNNLPDGIELSDTITRNARGAPVCRVVGCSKQAQGGNEGFCRSHFTKLTRKTNREVDDESEEDEKPAKPAPKRRSIDINDLPEGIELSDTILKNAKGIPICRVVGCPKQAQGGCERCCRSHFTKLTSNANLEEDNESDDYTPPPRIDFDNLPEGVAVEEKQPRNAKGVSVCRVVGCPKRAQFGNQGCCRSHFNLLAIEVKCADESSLEPWDCICGHSVSGRWKRCGVCHGWKDGVRESTPKKRKSRGSAKKKRSNEEMTEDWTCDCGNVVEAPKSRCGNCRHWRGGKRKGGWKLGTKQIYDDDDDDNIDRTTNWECCGEVILARQTRCGKCRSWRGGKRTVRWTHDGLPPKAIDDTNEKDEEVVDTSVSWECKKDGCGNSNEGQLNRCAKCAARRFSRKRMSVSDASTATESDDGEEVDLKMPARSQPSGPDYKTAESESEDEGTTSATTSASASDATPSAFVSTASDKGSKSVAETGSAGLGIGVAANSSTVQNGTGLGSILLGNAAIGSNSGHGAPTLAFNSTAKATQGSSKKAKKKRCGKCEACLQEDCRVCSFCLDMPRYGGPNIRKRGCKAKRDCIYSSTGKFPGDDDDDDNNGAGRNLMQVDLPDYLGASAFDFGGFDYLAGTAGGHSFATTAVAATATTGISVYTPSENNEIVEI